MYILLEWGVGYVWAKTYRLMWVPKNMERGTLRKHIGFWEYSRIREWSMFEWGHKDFCNHSCDSGIFKGKARGMLPNQGRRETEPCKNPGVIFLLQLLRFLFVFRFIYCWLSSCYSSCNSRKYQLQLKHVVCIFNWYQSGSSDILGVILSLRVVDYG